MSKYFVAPHNAYIPGLSEDENLKYLLMREKWIKLSRAGLTGKHLPDICDYDGIEKAYEDLQKALEANQEALKAVENQIESDRQDFLFKKFSGQIPHETLIGQNPSIAPIYQATAPNVITPQSSILLSEVIEKYIKKKELNKRWKREKSKNETTAILSLWVRILGDRPMYQIGYEEIEKAVATLHRLPPNLNKSKRYREKTIEQILAMDDVKPMAIKTLKKKIQKLSGLLKWASNRGYVDKNYAEEFTNIKEDQDKIEDTLPLDTADLESIFFGDQYLRRNGKHLYYDFNFWIPLLALFTGARLEEICQLRLEDIYTIDKTLVVSIRSLADDQKIKTSSAKREVPVRKELKELGFKNYLAQLKERGETRLFPELNLSSDRYGNRVSKWFNERFKKSCGIDHSKKTFHSFRHTFIENLKQNESIKTEAIEALVGHKSNSLVSTVYGNRYSIKLKVKAINKLDYGIDWSPLMDKRVNKWVK